MELLSSIKSVAVLGQGAFGTVHLYVKRSGGTSAADIYAVKRIKQALAASSGNVERVFAERDALMKCSRGSPFIATLHGVAKDRTYLYFILECAEGGDLNKHITSSCGRRLGETRARFYAAEIILGIRHMHEHGVVHRDLKANNIALTGEGHIKIFDFGLAKIICGGDATTEESTRAMRTRTRMGVSHMSAPEIVKGEPHGTAVDWWALGVLIYEMLWGAAPFPYVFGGDENPEELRSKILNEPVTLSADDVRAADLESRGAADLIEGLLRLDAQSRYGSSAGSVEIMSHHWFGESSSGDGESMPAIDWLALEAEKEPAPGFNNQISEVFRFTRPTAQEEFDASMSAFDDF